MRPWEKQKVLLRRWWNAGWWDRLLKTLWPLKPYEKPQVFLCRRWVYDAEAGCWVSIQQMQNLQVTSFAMHDIHTKAGAQEWLDSLPCNRGYTDPKVWRLILNARESLWAG